VLNLLAASTVTRFSVLTVQTQFVVTCAGRFKIKNSTLFPKRISVIFMALRTVIIAVITEVLDFYNRNRVFLLRRST